MKQKMKNYLKIGILLFGISIFLTNCEKESVLIDDISKQDNSFVFESLLENAKTKKELFNFKASTNQNARGIDASFEATYGTPTFEKTINFTNDQGKPILVIPLKDINNEIINILIGYEDENIEKFRVISKSSGDGNMIYVNSNSSDSNRCVSTRLGGKLIGGIFKSAKDLLESNNTSSKMALDISGLPDGCYEWDSGNDGCWCFNEVDCDGFGGGGGSGSGSGSGTGGSGGSSGGDSSSGGGTGGGSGIGGGSGGSGGYGGGGGGSSGGSGGSGTGGNTGGGSSGTGTTINPCGDIAFTMEMELNFAIENDPYLLLEIDCDQIMHWQTLAQHTAPQSVIDKINGLPSSTFNDFEIQSLSDANGTMVNLDYFPIKVTTLPNNPSTGLQFTADEFLDYFRRNINDFTTGSTFEPYCNISTICAQETTLWNSSDPTGALIYIDIPFDDGTVICTEYSNDYWYFMTMNAPYAGNHPVSGTRQFGYELNSDGSYNFFVRGVDRFDSNLVENASYIISGGAAFSGADDLWESFQEKLNQFVNDNGGISTELTPIKNRPDWNKVQDVLLGLRPISDLGCN